MSESARPALGELARTLAELAKAATPGPWCTDERYPKRVYCDDSLGSMIADCRAEYAMQLPDEQKRANAAFIAACSPAVILQLVALAAGGAADTARLDWLSAGNEARSAPYGYAVWCGERDDSTAGSSLRAAIDAASSLTPERPADAR